MAVRAAWNQGVALATLAWVSSAGAQSADDWKGMVAGGLLGAEAVVTTEALVGVHPTWAYWLGAGVGLGAGGVGGYYFAQSTGPRAPLYALAGSIALVLPSILAVASTLSERPLETHEATAMSGPILPRVFPQVGFARSEGEQPGQRLSLWSVGVGGWF